MSDPPAPPPDPIVTTSHGLVRRLGVFDATMLVMGGIVGAGIFVNPAEVARAVSSPTLIVGMWLVGGVIALLGAFVYAELAARRPGLGGQYAYLRDAYGPLPAFLYGWSLLLVIQSGGMAAVAITFARYFLELSGWPVAPGWVAAGVLALLTAINCLGVRAGASVQSGLMLLKIVAIAGLVLGALIFATPHPALTASVAQPGGLGLLGAFGAALTPVMFAYGGWQTASFMAGEMRDPTRDLSRALLLGVAGVVVCYAAVAFVCVYALGPVGLANSQTPATDAMRIALGERGAALVAVGITVSALGFLSQSILTSPRVYFAMAEDGLFFRSVATVSPRTHVPVVAIVLQGAVAAAIALSGSYGQILSYVVAVDFIWFALTGAALFVFRRRAPDATGFSAPGHPWTSALFVAACAGIVVATVANHPANSAVGFLILAAGVPAFRYWRARA
ncbi:MAG: amino acid permease [Pseudomonadota bacterium]